jgi:hypothetical protein
MIIAKNHKYTEKTDMCDPKKISSRLVVIYSNIINKPIAYNLVVLFQEDLSIPEFYDVYEKSMVNLNLFGYIGSKKDEFLNKKTINSSDISCWTLGKKQIITNNKKLNPAGLLISDSELTRLLKNK